MDIQVPLRDLGAIDASALRDGILAQEEIAWHEDRSRQESFYVHDQTRSIVMIAVDDDSWPAGAVTRGPGWNRIANAALPLMQEIVTAHYPEGGEVIRAIAANLEAGSRIRPTATSTSPSIAHTASTSPSPPTPRSGTPSTAAPSSSSPATPSRSTTRPSTASPTGEPMTA